VYAARHINVLQRLRTHSAPAWRNSGNAHRANGICNLFHTNCSDTHSKAACCSKSFWTS